jgi:predicted NUDIX family phosphoesterase
MKEMYYQRVISYILQRLLMCGGELHWLYELVKERKDLDFLIVANKSNEKILVYRGTTKLLNISFQRGLVRISADKKYTNLAHENNLDIYRVRDLADLDFKHSFVQLISYLPKDTHYDNKKEGYFQNLFSRRFGIESNGNEGFLVIDKEAVIGYEDDTTKGKYFSKQQEIFKAIRKHLSEIDEKRYGKNLGDGTLGNEVDFLAVNKDGDILLIEFKHGSSTKGIYLSPIQIGLYCSIFQDYISSNKDNFIDVIGDMIKQKKAMGLISSNFPEVNLSCRIVPMLVIAQFNPRSSALDKFNEVLQICRQKLNDNAWLSNLKVYEYDECKELVSIRY